MKISEICNAIELWAPPALQESYDNSKLLCGNAATDCTGVVTTLDCTEAVVQEAIDKGCNFIVAHHPIVFSGLKSLTGRTYVERTLIKAIKHDVAIYAVHTNLDNVHTGVNAKIAEQLGLINTEILLPKKGFLKKLFTFCPRVAAEEVRRALFSAGAGSIGDYDNCSFNMDGTGTFRGNENSNPYVGEQGKDHAEPETKIEVIFPAYLENNVVRSLVQAHPYEEAAYDIVSIDNAHPRIGSGMIGELPDAMGAMDFLRHVKEKMQTPCIRHTELVKDQVKTVAVCGGSGRFLLPNAIGKGADFFITADFKYHEFFDADGKITVADIGHFESEQFTKELLAGFLAEKFSTFAVHLSEVNTNPVHYFL